MPRKRIDEWIAFEAFYNVVTTTLGLTIDDYKQLENDPPDFLFAIDGRHYGAEVTQVCDGSQRAYSQFKKFCLTLEKLASEYSLQLGAWRCMMRGSPAIPNVNTRKGMQEIRTVLEELRNL